MNLTSSHSVHSYIQASQEKGTPNHALWLSKQQLHYVDAALVRRQGNCGAVEPFYKRVRDHSGHLID